MCLLILIITRWSAKFVFPFNCLEAVGCARNWVPIQTGILGMQVVKVAKKIYLCFVECTCNCSGYHN